MIHISTVIWRSSKDQVTCCNLLFTSLLVKWFCTRCPEVSQISSFQQPMSFCWWLPWCYKRMILWLYSELFRGGILNTTHYFHSFRPVWMLPRLIQSSMLLSQGNSYSLTILNTQICLILECSFWPCQKIIMSDNQNPKAKHLVE